MMYNRTHYPDELSHQQLDEYLKKGWFRMGQTIFTCEFLFFHQNIYSAIWIRLPLKKYEFKKRLRKLFNRNKHFKTIIRKADINAEKEHLYQHYRAHFDDYISETIQDALMDNSAGNIYDTYETCVYDGDKLIATSFFDIGKNSIASIKGVYHPEYTKYSLGFYTMLLEMAWGLENNYAYYYPGYVVPRYPRFDYKLRIGRLDEVEYFDIRKNKWIEYSQLVINDLPLEKMRTKVLDLSKELQNLGLESRVVLQSPSRLFPLALFYFPILIITKRDEHIFVSCYDVESENYKLFVSLFPAHFETKTPLIESPNMEEVLHEIRYYHT